VQDRQQRDRHGPGEVEQPRSLGKDRGSVAEVSVDVLGGARLAAVQQRAGVSEDHRVVVDVHDAGLRRDGLGDLVGVARRRDAGADVEELADARLPGEVPDHAAEERPVRPRAVGHVRPDLKRRVHGRPVRRVVVLPPST
jgi:hypothetical protein